MIFASKGMRWERFMRVLVAAFALVFVGYAAAARADSPTSAGTFVEHGADQATAILKDKSLSASDRDAKIGDMISSLLDLKRAALFTLGDAATTASPDDVSAFEDAYARFSIARYESMLGSYGGETISITGATERAANDFIVSVDVIGANAKPGDPPEAQVLLRVLDEDGKFAIVDASIEGVWFVVAQRGEYQEFLKANGNDVKALTARLDSMAANFKNGTAAAN